MESFFNQTPNISMKLMNESDDTKRAIYDFVTRIERISPYGSVVRFNLIEKKNQSFSARLEVVTNSFEILLSKSDLSLVDLLKEISQSFDERLKPWLEGRFSA